VSAVELGEHTGSIESFDGHRGTGFVVDDTGARFPFHCTAIADGTREIAVGARVSFVVTPGLGRWEAGSISRT
jgi:cold shock CspA family protein